MTGTKKYGAIILFKQRFSKRKDTLSLACWWSAITKSSGVCMLNSFANFRTYLVKMFVSFISLLMLVWYSLLKSSCCYSQIEFYPSEQLKHLLQMRTKAETWRQCYEVGECSSKIWLLYFWHYVINLQFGCNVLPTICQLLTFFERRN